MTKWEELWLEFEDELKDLEGLLDDPLIPPVIKDNKESKPKCEHKWMYTGFNPNNISIVWYNCKHCNMRKEDYDEKTGTS